MTGIVADLREVRGGLVSRVHRIRTMIARATAVPLLVRGTIFVAGVLATLVVYPLPVVLRSGGLVLLALALLPAIAPRSRLVTLFLGVTVVGWLATTTGYGEPVTLLRLFALAGSLYAVHSTAALAAYLPYDAIVSPGVLLRWFARAGLVIGATAVLTVYALVVAELLRGRATAIATVVGLGVAVGVAALLASQLRRPDR
ncbi:MAG TPA: hypothetical protein VFE14_06680 [Micromonosporaceae bacterium]|nr:hypothetical protein [Micromonosporaceae bacterium]